MKIFLAGHNGMVGSAVHKALNNNSDVSNVLTCSKKELDLLDQQSVKSFFRSNSFDCVIIAAAKVGGILANSKYPASFIFENLQIQNNLIHSCHEFNINKIIFLGSSCIYPKYAKQPIKEDYLLTSELEKTNEAYALAKISGLKMCEFYNQQYDRDYRCLMPTNLYGPNDNFNLDDSHVLPALIAKMHHAKLNSENFVEIWGTGKVSREFLHVDDLALACVHVLLMSKEKFAKAGTNFINIGTGKDISIGDLAHLIKKIVGYDGDLIFDTTKPDGTPRKLLDISKAKELGWANQISLEDGILSTYEWYKKNINKVRA